LGCGLRTLLPLSPLGIVPQRKRLLWLIVDFTYSGVNDKTARLAPSNAIQFGKALQRILTKLMQSDPFLGPVHLGMIDIAEGIYSIHFQPHNIPWLDGIFPSNGWDPMVAFPIALSIGWVDCLPYFTSVTETACNLLNLALRWSVNFYPTI
jgi:hypothetical protein